MESTPDIKTSENENPSPNNNIFYEIIYSPVNLLLTLIIAVLVYKIYKSRFSNKVAVESPELPKLRKDMTVAELRQYDGTQTDGRVLVAVNGWIFDVTRGRRFYGPGKHIFYRNFTGVSECMTKIC